MPDHPRSRGEYAPHGHAFFLREGSSPLSRGIRCPETAGCAIRGIIPALAGNTRTPHQQQDVPSDHPRSRGEYGHPRECRLIMAGSSPLSRGIHRVAHRHGGNRGIIPALAGNTRPSSRSAKTWPDHPRSRGEYVATGYGDTLPSGSSPLSRGIPAHRRHPGRSPGIIPALAGNTVFHAGQHIASPDHPRSRGEYNSREPVTRYTPGSSPLSRGILVQQPRVRYRDRIIPALAGNTVNVMFPELPAPDHPRSRGEYTSNPAGSLRANGSSPLSRGIRRLPGRNPSRSRIIPALAGNTSCRSSSVCSQWDHPRSRGEY